MRRSYHCRRILVNFARVLISYLSWHWREEDWLNGKLLRYLYPRHSDALQEQVAYRINISWRKISFQNKLNRRNLINNLKTVDEWKKTYFYSYSILLMILRYMIYEILRCCNNILPKRIFLTFTMNWFSLIVKDVPLSGLRYG